MKSYYIVLLFIISIAQNLGHQIRSTNEDRTFALLFDPNDGLFANAAEFEQNANLSITSQEGNTQIQVPFSATFLSQSRDLMKLIINTENIAVGSVVSIEFSNLDNNYKLTFPSLASSSFSDQEQNNVERLTKVDRALEYAWIAVSCLEPTGFLYMNTKLYRETLEALKKTNVQYGAWTTQFFRMNSNKNSGFKAPNMFSILLQKDDVTSGWNRGQENDLFNAERVNDLAIPSSVQVINYDAFPLFLDNYGVQITVFLAIFVLIIVFEIVCFAFKKQKTAAKFFEKIRKFLRWNLLIACIFGSYQSLLYFLMVQIQSFAFEEGHSQHSKISFWFAIGTAIVLLLFFPLWLVQRIISISKVRAKQGVAPDNSRFFIFVFKVFKIAEGSKRSWMFALLLLVRTTAFAALTLFLKDYPIVQISVLTGISFLTLVCLCILRPFQRRFYFAVQILNEISLVLYLSTLLYLSYQMEYNILENNESEIAGYILVSFWLLIPALAIIFGVYNLILRIIRRRSPQKEKLPIAVTEQQAVLGDHRVDSGTKLSELFRVTDEEEDGNNQTSSKTRGSIVDLNNHHGKYMSKDEGVTVLSAKLSEEPQPRRCPPQFGNIEIIIEDAENEQGSADPKFYNYRMNESILAPQAVETHRRPRVVSELAFIEGISSGPNSLQNLNTSSDGEDSERVQDRVKSYPTKLSAGSLRKIALSNKLKNQRLEARNPNIFSNNSERGYHSNVQQQKIIVENQRKIQANYLQEGFRISKERHQFDDN